MCEHINLPSAYSAVSVGSCSRARAIRTQTEGVDRTGGETEAVHCQSVY